MAKQKDPRERKSEKRHKVLEQAELALQQALAREEQVRNELHQVVAEVVHDIKNPLNALIAYSEVLKTEALGPIGSATYKDYAGTIHLSALRLLEYCETLIAEHTTAMEDASASPAAFEDIEATAIVEEVVTMFQGLAEQRGIHLDCSVPSDFPQLHTLPTHLHRVMTNLLSNALKFTPKGGNVTVGAEIDKEKDAMIMVIRDSGTGISGDDIMRILDPESRTAGPHDDKSTGLGLNVVNRLIRECGGKMSISSKEEKGTVVRLHFPRDGTRTAAKPRKRRSIGKMIADG
jgi:two-component system, cell cycle sensor histidine kinase PleC